MAGVLREGVSGEREIQTWSIFQTQILPFIMSLGRQSLLRPVLACSRPCKTRRISVKSTAIIETDSCGIPIKPTWSVNDLLSSYPTPAISSATIKHLHKLSALIPPAEGTPEHEILTRELEELVRLVEAVKLVALKDITEDEGVPDGRVWAEGTGIRLDQGSGADDAVPLGGSLLQHAARTSEGLYVTDAHKAR